MSIERAEQLKEKLTDKFVVVDNSIPELRRFANWTGKVRTVNMSCRALVEFDGPVDIGWYDINPDYLIVVDGPRPKVAPAAKAHAKAPAATTEAKPAAAKPAAAAGKSPLDAIRAQQAAKAAGGAPAPAAAGAKLSPLDMIRKQQAAKAAGGEAAAPVAEAPAPAAAAPEPAPAAAPPAEKPALPTTGPDGKPLSKLDLIRMQGAKKS
jgi:hypothetical protein